MVYFDKDRPLGELLALADTGTSMAQTQKVKFFRDLKPDFIKMDSTYTLDIDEDKNNQYFLRLMVDLAHRLSVSVLVESVETQEEKFILEKLFVDGCRAFILVSQKTLRQCS